MKKFENYCSNLNVLSRAGQEDLTNEFIIGGIIEGILGLFAKYWVKLISPIVAASVVTAIGFSLLSVGATSIGRRTAEEDFASAINLILGSISFVCCSDLS